MRNGISIAATGPIPNRGHRDRQPRCQLLRGQKLLSGFLYKTIVGVKRSGLRKRRYILRHEDTHPDFSDGVPLGPTGLQRGCFSAATSETDISGEAGISFRLTRGMDACLPGSQAIHGQDRTALHSFRTVIDRRFWVCLYLYSVPPLNGICRNKRVTRRCHYPKPDLLL